MNKEEKIYKTLKALKDEIKLNSSFLEVLFDVIPIPIFYKDKDGVYLNCNNAFSKTILGIVKEKIIGKTLYEFPEQIPKELADFYKKKDNEILDSLGTQYYESKVKCSDNIERDYNFYKSTFVSDLGEGLGIVGIMLDVSDYKNIQKQLNTDIIREKELKLKYMQQAQVLDQVSDSIITTDIKGNILSWNRGSQDMLGYRADEVIGKPMSIIHRPEDKEKNIKYANRLLNESSFKVEAYLVKKSQNLIYVSISLSSLQDKNGNTIGLIGVSHDISKRKKDEEKLLEENNILEHKAHHDLLTSLPNRVLFYDRLSQSIKKSIRNQKKIALLFIDLDNFKPINDSYGHDVGDDVLKEVSTRLKNTLREEDTLARLGGDEFTIIMENIKEEKNAALLAQKIIFILSEQMLINDITFQISCSVGISVYPKDTKNMNELLKYADIAMYRSKNNGGNNFVFY
ncbi:diguanylate cyclase domain-containing protein [Sulfurimonas sp.]|uniref:diguanylate cyclase domain-containing protein n=1 Tax=Sulfurimonas sp. TaxID=2022749 RepID=UPI002AAF9DF0|nr:diguanylate cyclase [Sulfurimonas sp.]